MASKRSDALKTMYATWLSAMGANPTMSLEETRELTGESIKSRAHLDAIVQARVLKNMAATFLGNAAPKAPLASPLHAELKGLPPRYIQVGDHATLLDDSTRFAERAKAAGVDCTCEVWPEMQHVFEFLAGTAPEADEASGTLAHWVKPKLGLA